MNDDDLTLETLLSVRNNVAPGLSEELLKGCYQVQKRFQFSDDRAVVVAEMEKLVDGYVKSLGGEV